MPYENYRVIQLPDYMKEWNFERWPYMMVRLPVSNPGLQSIELGAPICNVQ